MHFDLSLFNFIHGFAGRHWLIDWAGIFLGEYLPYALVLYALYFGLVLKVKERIRFFTFMILTLILSRGILTILIRHFFPRPRPFLTLNFAPLITGETSASFPSGHATFYFALAFAFFYFNKKAGWWFFIAAVLIGLGRIFGGVHWPSDVLAGAVIGWLSALFVGLVIDKKFMRLGFSRKEEIITSQ